MAFFIKEFTDKNTVPIIEPHWIFKWGNGLLAIIILVCILMSAFISYPDSICEKVKLISFSSPKDSVSGRIKIKLKIPIECKNKIRIGANLVLRVRKYHLTENYTFTGRVEKLFIDSFGDLNVFLDNVYCEKCTIDLLKQDYFSSEKEVTVFGENRSLIERGLSKVNPR